MEAIKKGIPIMQFVLPVIYFAFFIELARIEPKVWGFVIFSAIIYLCHRHLDKDERETDQ